MKRYLPNKKILSILIIIAIFILYFSWPKDLEIASEPPVIKVKTIHAKASDKIEELELIGISKTNQKIDIKSDIDGNIFQIFVKEGDLIKEDEEIFSIASIEQYSILSAAMQKHNFAKQNNNNISSAEIALNKAKAFSKQHFVRSPFTGYVDKINIVKGETIHKGDLIASIVNLDPLIIESYLPEQYSTYLATGTKVKVNFANFSSQEGKIIHISRNADIDTKNLLIKIEIKNQHNVNNNVSCKITLPLRTIKAFKIPSSSLTIDEQGFMGIKYLSENNIVGFSPVKLISQDENNLWVTSNISELNIIILGQNLVKEGQKAIAEIEQ